MSVSVGWLGSSVGCFVSIERVDHSAVDVESAQGELFGRERECEVVMSAERACGEP